MNQLPQRTWNPVVRRIGPKKAKIYRIRKVSTKRAKINKEYAALRNRFLTDYPYCQFYLRENGVKGWDRPFDSVSFLIERADWPRSEEIHHKRHRGKYLLDTSTWMAVSRTGHLAIHADPKTSYEKGYMLHR